MWTAYSNLGFLKLKKSDSSTQGDITKLTGWYFIHQGRPVYIERIGLLDLTNLFKITTKERLLRHYIRECEKAKLFIYPICSKVYKRLIEQCVIIMDLNKGSSKIFSSDVRSIVQEVSKLS